jgi:replicative DNA helicase
MADVMNDELDRAELAVLGAAVLSGGQILEDLDFNPRDFRAPNYEHAYRVIDQLRRDGKPIDAITTTNAIAADGGKDLTLIHRAVDETPSPETAVHYAGIVQDAANRRRLSLVGKKITQLAQNPGDADALIEEARKILDNNVAHTKTEPVQYVWETIEATIDELDSDDNFIPTPWDNLNHIIGGLRPGALYTIGARPSVGKSVVGVQLAQALAQHGSVAFFSLEMSQSDVNKRILSNTMKISMSHLMNPKQLTPADWEKIANWTANYRQPIAVAKSQSIDMTGIKRFTRNVHRREPLAGIVVDYLQLMAQAPGDRRARHEFVADMSRNLKLLAMDMNVPVIMLSQLNRQSENRENKAPMLSDLRESGAIEQDSDVVILLHRQISGPGSEDMKMLVAKNRHGAANPAEFTFRGHYSQITDAQNHNDF